MTITYNLPPRPFRSSRDTVRHSISQLFTERPKHSPFGGEYDRSDRFLEIKRSPCQGPVDWEAVDDEQSVSERIKGKEQTRGVSRPVQIGLSAIRPAVIRLFGSSCDDQIWVDHASVSSSFSNSPRKPGARSIRIDSGCSTPESVKKNPKRYGMIEFGSSCMADLRW
jgi:hypothetical protein